MVETCMLNLPQIGISTFKGKVAICKLQVVFEFSENISQLNHPSVKVKTNYRFGTEE